ALNGIGVGHIDAALELKLVLALLGGRQIDLKLAYVGDLFLNRGIDGHFRLEWSGRNLIFWITDDQIGDFEIGFHCRVSLRIQLNICSSIDGDRNQLFVCEHWFEESSNAVLIEIAQFRGELRRLVRSVCAGNVKGSTWFPVLC